MTEILKQIFTLGLMATKEERELSNKINNSYKTLRVVGRGTIIIDASEVKQDMKDNGLFDRAKDIVETNN